MAALEMLKNANAAERRRNPLSDRTNSNPTQLNSTLPSSSSNSTKRTRCGATGVHVSEPISVFCSRIHTLNANKKNKNQAMANPKFSNIRNKRDAVEDLDVPEAKPLTVPCRKKQRAVHYEQDMSEDAQLQDFIEKQKAYFKEIDEFKLTEEEVKSVDELD
ncbi:hypothetical protein VNO77_43861 [Canavalia gladiata]|uniref:Sororin C-terminal region domain-containing protein n=1 Tax=Canavalia gladiata TaxID=3824 RepID=A0AAN9JVL1_CANGL